MTPKAITPAGSYRTEIYGELASETLERQTWDMSYKGRVSLREGDYEVALAELRKQMRRSLRLDIVLIAWWLLYSVAMMTWGGQADAELGSTGWKMSTLGFWIGLLFLVVGVALAASTGYLHGRKRDACDTIENLLRHSKEAGG